MPLNFPASPTDGQVYTDAATGNQYRYKSAFSYWETYKLGGGTFQGNNGDINLQNNGDIFRSHSNTLSANVIVYAGTNSIAAGPLNISANGRLIIEDGARVSIV